MPVDEKMSAETMKEGLEDAVLVLEKLSQALGEDSVEKLLEIAKLALTNDSQLKMIMAAMSVSGGRKR